MQEKELKEEYNMPSIEKDGHQWIRVVDHLNIISTHYISKEEVKRKIDELRGKRGNLGKQTPSARVVKGKIKVLSDLLSSLTNQE